MMTLEDIIEMLKKREEGIRDDIQKAWQRNDAVDRIHYIGWLRGVKTSRELLEWVAKDKE
jgi:hypothetical protein